MKLKLFFYFSGGAVGRPFCAFALIAAEGGDQMPDGRSLDLLSDFKRHPATFERDEGYKRSR